ncbi:uncharacterized protein DNG_00168 [Cephalotrichum gorgonifer]|uniref:Uncharacterized protein n=1 Tax=Cephalotrichum gorgonifer TaxID=2041049 RepID=A0AAE8SQI6_9PEZI|nr:uncharacterized protein DNG_00168 [Cephalotrichum gorgonifer]
MSFGVGVGDIVLVSGLAWKLFKACRDSSDDFKRLSTDLMSLHAVLLETEDYLKEHANLDLSRQHRLSILHDSCRATLSDLEEIVNRYESLGTQAQRTWDRFCFGLKDVSAISSRLVSTTTMLSAFNIALITSSTSRIEKRLNKFMAEVQAGLREGSVVTTNDVTETLDSPDVWQELRRELEDVGISTAVIEENREYITSWMKRALAEGMVDESPGDNIQSDRKVSVSGTSDSYTLVASPGSGGSIASQRRLSNASASVVGANDKFEQDLQEQKTSWLVQEAADYTALKSATTTSLKPKKRLDVGRFLQKMVTKDKEIIRAASEGDIEKVGKLLGVGVDVNARDQWGWSALSMCAYGGHKAIARLLLDHGADLDNVDVDGDTPPRIATAKGHADLVVMFDEERAARDLRVRQMDGEVPRR